MKKWFKKEIDERQQAELNRVTGMGYWIAFYLLIGAIMVEAVILQRPSEEWIVEWAVFMVLAVYEVVQCVRIGVWTEYKRKPEKKDYFRASIFGSLLFSLLFAGGYYVNMDEAERSIGGVLGVFGLWFLILFAVLLAAFFAIGGWFNKRQEKMEEKMNEELSEE